MMGAMKPSKLELVEAQIALFGAIGLQVVVWRINHGFLAQPQYLVILVEVILALLLGFTSGVRNLRGRSLQHGAATILIGLITFANFASLAIVIYALITGEITNGPSLLGSAIAIFFTNVIVYALWYWEVDSPGLTNRKWTKSDKDFQFTQQDTPKDFPNWRPTFADYLYISVTNAVNFAPADTRPLTLQAKALMGTQALISVFTLALVIARSINILG